MIYVVFIIYHFHSSIGKGDYKTLLTKGAVNFDLIGDPPDEG